MKKVYSKPHVIFESFVLSNSIGGGCDYFANASRSQCGVYVDEFEETLFTSETVLGGACSMTPAPGMFDDICYDVPHDNTGVFSS